MLSSSRRNRRSRCSFRSGWARFRCSGRGAPFHLLRHDTHPLRVFVASGIQFRLARSGAHLLSIGRAGASGPTLIRVEVRRYSPGERWTTRGCMGGAGMRLTFSGLSSRRPSGVARNVLNAPPAPP
ncbi:hypothetical protein MRX96_027141 [Rhipicephalus microplus]